MTILKCQQCGYACYGPCHFCGHTNEVETDAPSTQSGPRRIIVVPNNNNPGGIDIIDEQIIDDEPDPIKPSLINKFLSWLKN